MLLLLRYCCCFYLCLCVFAFMPFVLAFQQLERLRVLLLLQREGSADDAALAAAVLGPTRTAAAEEQLQQALGSLVEREFLRRDEENP